MKTLNEAFGDLNSLWKDPDDDQDVPATCPYCGTRLNDGGTCPKCDDGEEDYGDSSAVEDTLDESFNESSRKEILAKLSDDEYFSLYDKFYNANFIHEVTDISDIPDTLEGQPIKYQGSAGETEEFDIYADPYWQNIFVLVPEKPLRTEAIEKDSISDGDSIITDEVFIEPEMGAESADEPVEVLSDALKDPEEASSVEEEPSEDSEIEEINNDLAEINGKARDVMAAYQTANRWLDTVKEAIYIDMSCPFFSSYVHELAHSMPERFDIFGEILHTINMPIPYPETKELSNLPKNLDEAFGVIFTVLNDIKAALNTFITATDKDYHGMACAAEACLNDIENEYPMLYRLKAKAEECGEDTISFDKFVGQYEEHKDTLLA